ncbi:MAG: response regulator transcription factor [Ruminococcus sp.]|nr:response regulator transcription factor [Ruminococcus sp.]
MYQILLVEDEQDIREIIADYFAAKSGGALSVVTARDGQEGLEKAYEHACDLLLLDINLPRIDGFEICREVRQHSDVPIIFITARAGEADMLSGYALGCDDYVVKPFPLPVLYQKTLALLKRAKGLVRSPVYRCGALTLNPNNGAVHLANEPLRLTAKEYAVLKMLMENRGRIVSRAALVERIWGWDADVDERVLDSHIKNLRKSLGNHAHLLKTVVRRGYRMEDEDEQTT